MKTKLSTIIIALVALGTWVYATSLKVSDAPVVANERTIDIREFEETRDSLYDYAMTICTGLMQYEDSWLYDVVDEQTIDILKSHRVPGLNVLLHALDQIDEDGDLSDIYDDDEGTLFKYDRMREKYNSFFVHQ